MHQVELITRDITGPLSSGQAEIDLAAMVDGHRVDLPEGAEVAVIYDAGASTATVHLPVMAGTVRHVAEHAIPEHEPEHRFVLISDVGLNGPHIHGVFEKHPSVDQIKAAERHARGWTGYSGTTVEEFEVER
jgi:hypothetical protein